jgi:hypothetical protein
MAEVQLYPRGTKASAITVSSWLKVEHRNTVHFDLVSTIISQGSMTKVIQHTLHV